MKEEQDGIGSGGSGSGSDAGVGIGNVGAVGGVGGSGGDGCANKLCLVCGDFMRAPRACVRSSCKGRSCAADVTRCGRGGWSVPLLVRKAPELGVPAPCSPMLLMLSGAVGEIT